MVSRLSPMMGAPEGSQFWRERQCQFLESHEQSRHQRGDLYARRQHHHAGQRHCRQPDWQLRVGGQLRRHGCDGTYASSPISITFEGTFEGLGNTIWRIFPSGTRFTVDKVGCSPMLGQAVQIVNLRSDGPSRCCEQQWIRGLGSPDRSDGILSQDAVAGLVSWPRFGLLPDRRTAGLNNGTIVGTHSTATVRDRSGLVGINKGAISDSYATVPIVGSDTGGLVSLNEGSLADSFATDRSPSPVVFR